MKHRRQRNTIGKPNLAEWFRYHTAVGRFYYDFEDASDRAIIRGVVGLGLVACAATVYLAVAFFN